MRKLIMILSMLSLLVLAVAPSVLAEAQQGDLTFASVDAYVDGDKDSISVDGGNINDVKPESTLKIKFKIENLAESGSENEIEDVYVEGVLEGIDDGDDLDDETDEYDISAGRTKSATLEFDIPLLVDEGDYTLKVYAEGRNENGTRISYEADYTVEVEKERHDVRITRLEVEDPTLECRDSTRLRLNIVNLGSEEEEEVKLEISNDDLGIDINKKFDLDYGSDDDSMYSSYITLEVPEDAEAGKYPVNVKVLYYKENRELNEEFDLEVLGCEIEEEEEEVEQVVVIQKEEPIVDSMDTTPVPTAAVTVSPTSAKKSFFTEGQSLALVILAYIIVISIIVAMFMKLLKK